MAPPSSTGVKGFFEDYGKKHSLPNTTPIKTDDVAKNDAIQGNKTPRGGERAKKRARTGRPPGIASGSRSAKAKATMHIDSTLMDFYRDWSWEERCNLGELIERAMRSYKEGRTRDRRGRSQ